MAVQRAVHLAMRQAAQRAGSTEGHWAALWAFLLAVRMDDKRAARWDVYLVVPKVDQKAAWSVLMPAAQLAGSMGGH